MLQPVGKPECPTPIEHAGPSAYIASMPDKQTAGREWQIAGSFRVPNADSCKCRGTTHRESERGFRLDAYDRTPENAHRGSSQQPRQEREKSHPKLRTKLLR